MEAIGGWQLNNMSHTGGSGVDLPVGRRGIVEPELGASYVELVLMHVNYPVVACLSSLTSSPTASSAGRQIIYLCGGQEAGSECNGWQVRGMLKGHIDEPLLVVG